MAYSVSHQTPFSLLPKTRTPWTEFVFSTGAQACVVAFLIWLRLLQPTIVSPPEHTFRSVQLVSTPVPVNHQPQPVRPLPKPVFVANVDPPVNALRLPAPQLAPRATIGAIRLRCAACTLWRNPGKLGPSDDVGVLPHVSTKQGKGRCPIPEPKRWNLGACGPTPG